MTDPVLVVNGRFVTQPVTGVQRVARELSARLPDVVPHRVLVAVPPDRLVPVDEALATRPSERWSGIRGHVWEQLQLPILSRGFDLLVSLCNSGPVAVRSQVVAIFDVAPLRYPELYRPAFVHQTRWVQHPLARRSRRVVVPSRFSAEEIHETHGVPRDRLDLVPCGVGPPFTDRPQRVERSARCLFVGGHDARKNLQFLIDLWPRVHRELRLELVVVARATSRPHAERQASVPAGVLLVEDPDDDALVDLYDSALCVLSPSRYEGFGLPLLEGMARGTPFLATPVGAAPELAVRSEQLLDLDPERWFHRLADWRGRDLNELRERSRAVAESYSWRDAAVRLGESIATALRSA